MKRRLLKALIVFFVLCVTGWGANQATAAKDIRMSTTTSTENSGLLGYLLPVYEAKCSCKVRVISVGTGKALELGKNGDVDVVLVHARPSEDKFVAEGHGVNRSDVMYNDFILVGSQTDPLRLRGTKDVIAAFKILGEGKAKFISRGDNSGTDQMEKNYWKQAGVEPKGAWFISAGLGMGEVLTMAGELQAYTLSDRATYGAYRSKTGLDILVQGDPKMFNPYGVIAVNPKKYPDANYEGAMDFINWITSDEGQKRIAEFKVDGEQLFFPSAKKDN
ncbi:MAG TPA: substrate-binding domain-containing protein [Burkholderiales bacterium]|nr:substrate-binding domain-containing protein [Burkholderiales bacterium]